MQILRGFAVLMVLALAAQNARAGCLFGPGELHRVNCQLHGSIIDHTCNHGADRRIWSRALCEKRDLYVYLPPCFDPNQCYPVVLYLHGYAEDERALFSLIRPIDRAIAEKRMPPVIIAAPDGSINGRQTYLRSASFFANSRAGNFEDYIMHDVWPFLLTHYPIHEARDAHAIAGASMGGGAAYHLAIKYPHTFRHVIGIMPAVNLRWVDCRGRYMSKFDPCCWGWRNSVRPCEVVGRFYGVVPIHSWMLMCPVFGFNDDAIARMAAVNPIEMLDRYNVSPGQFDMYIAYGGLDEFNLDAQAESFIYRARQRGLGLTVSYDPNGRHNIETGLRFVPHVIDWLGPRLAPFSPGWSVRAAPTLVAPRTP